jgi:coenzyme F420-0:L-glutamate ligase / coenzyme F420-1:gamma-L-glutamate ligase
VTVELHPVRHVPEVVAGDDLAAVLLDGIAASGLRLIDGDVLVVTQKVVSKAEGRVVPEQPIGKEGWVRAETRRVVARRGDLVIAETAHGFVCANAGVDASNVADGFLCLLPVDPDGTAEHLRDRLSVGAGADVAVVVTDTFGRPWRQGLVNVAIGCAGLPSLVDLRGTKDASGRVLDVTVEALADEIAAASGLVVGKADGIPAAIVRGVRLDGPALPAAGLIREASGDLFRESLLQSLLGRRDGRRLGAGEVGRDVVDEAIAAFVAPLRLAQRPSRAVVVALEPGPARRRLLRLVADPARRDAIASAPVVMAPFAKPDTEAARTDALVAGGGGIQNALLAFHARGLAAAWIPPTELDGGSAGPAVGLAEERVESLGIVVAGWPVEEA